MSFLRPSIIQAGNVALKGFEQDGIYRQSQGIESYHRLVHSRTLLSLTPISYTVPANLQILSMWFVSDEVTPITDESIITFRLSDNLMQIYTTWLQLKALDYKVGISTFVWEPPFVILEQESRLQLIFNFPILYVGIFGKVADLYQDTLGTV